MMMMMMMMMMMAIMIHTCTETDVCASLYESKKLTILVKRKAKFSRGYIKLKTDFCLDDSTVEKAFLKVESINLKFPIKDFK